MRRERAELPARETYRHGDLRRALLDAGIALARAGGPEAVVLREATRRAGVVPNAAYRHFTNRDDLMFAVRAAALAALGDAIRCELAKLDPNKPADEFARASLRTVGLGYLAFAAAEPGLFRTAFVITTEHTAAANADKPPPEQNPFELLGSALDQMVAAELLPSARRPGAEILAWSSVHGLAMLLNDGPLAHLTPEMRAKTAEGLVEMVERGI